MRIVGITTASGLAKPHVEDNRYGARFGGPIIHDKTFFFAEYEARRYPETFQISSIVPTATLKQGILRFKDAAGNIDSYNLASSTLCGPTGNQACDPRHIGLSPTMQAMMALEPAGNNTNVAGRGQSEHHWLHGQRSITADAGFRHVPPRSQHYRQMALQFEL